MRINSNKIFTLTYEVDGRDWHVAISRAGIVTNNFRSADTAYFIASVLDRHEEVVTHIQRAYEVLAESNRQQNGVAADKEVRRFHETKLRDNQIILRRALAADLDANSKDALRLTGELQPGESPNIELVAQFWEKRGDILVFRLSRSSSVMLSINPRSPSEFQVKSAL